MRGRNLRWAPVCVPARHFDSLLIRASEPGQSSHAAGGTGTGRRSPQGVPSRQHWVGGRKWHFLCPPVQSRPLLAADVTQRFLHQGDGGGPRLVEMPGARYRTATALSTGASNFTNGAINRHNGIEGTIRTAVKKKKGGWCLKNQGRRGRGGKRKFDEGK